MKKSIAYIWLCLLCSLHISIGRKWSDIKYIQVGIFHKMPVSSVLLSPVSGKYYIYGSNGKIDSLYQNDKLKIVKLNQNVILYKNNKKINTDHLVFIIEEFEGQEIEVTINGLSELKRIYPDNIKIFSHATENSLSIVNHVDLDRYAAGVAEAEGGRVHLNEYYKVQIILARTYAVGSMRRHESEGFHLCDRVHCQVYFGKAKSNKIQLAAKETSGLVVVDEKYQPIQAAFHSNCGGITVNSEDIWTYPQSYLKSIIDSFCINEKNSTWEKQLSLHEWKNFLRENYPCALNYLDSMHWAMYRGPWVQWDSCKISKAKIRDYFRLKSTYFSAVIQNHQVYFQGRGFGHGVGLCQEGAMKMARMGYDFKSIIYHYFTNVKIVHLNYLDYFALD